MAITLAQARSRVRDRLRHNENDPRLDNTKLDDLIYQEEVALRVELRTMAPAYGLTTVSGLVLDSDSYINMDNGACAFDALYRVEWLVQGLGYRQVFIADVSNPNVSTLGRINYRQEGCRLIFGPDSRAVGQTISVTYYSTPGQTTGADDELPVPVGTELVLVLRACKAVAETDGDDQTADRYEAKAEQELKRVTPSLRKTYGTQNPGGLRRVLGY